MIKSTENLDKLKIVKVLTPTQRDSVPETFTVILQNTNNTDQNKYLIHKLKYEGFKVDSSMFMSKNNVRFFDLYNQNKR